MHIYRNIFGIEIMQLLVMRGIKYLLVCNMSYQCVTRIRLYM